jgi:hypothetical protein
MYWKTISRSFLLFQIWDDCMVVIRAKAFVIATMPGRQGYAGHKARMRRKVYIIAGTLLFIGLSVGWCSRLDDNARSSSIFLKR